MKRVCLVSDYLVGMHDNWSGAELVVQYLSGLLQKEGTEVSFLTTWPGRKTPGNVFPIPLGKLTRFLATVRQLRKIKPDVVHLFHTNSLFVPVMLAAKILRIPTTFTVLDYFIICPTRHLMLKDGGNCRKKEGWHCLKCISLPRLLERKLVRYLAKDLRQLVTFTETSKRRLVAHGFPEEKIKVKYIYEFSSKGADNGGGQKRDILFVGTFRPQKGLEVIVRAMPAVIEKVPAAKLTVVGRGSGADKERIENLVKNLGLKDTVDFLGQKDNQETLKIISESKLVVVAEQWFSDFGPVALLEAMAQGRPVVSGSIGSPPDFIKDGFNGFLVKHNSPEQFAEKIVWLLENKEAAEEVGRRAKETVGDSFDSGQRKEIYKLYTKL